MKISTLRLSILSCMTLLMLLPTAFANPIVIANSELVFEHAYEINNGAVPEGIAFDITPSTLVLANSNNSNVDTIDAENVTTTNVSVANPFANPPSPYEAFRSDRTAFNGGIEGAQTQFNVNDLSVDDAESDTFNTEIVERWIDNSGQSEAVLFTQDVDANASSSFTMSRGYDFENTSNDEVSFFIFGELNFSLLSEYEQNSIEGSGQASSSLEIFTLFEQVEGTSVLFDLFLPFDPDFELTGPNVTAQSILDIDPNMSSGFSLTAETMASNGDTPSAASVSESIFYSMQITMQPNTQLFFTTGYYQETMVNYNAPDANVSSPSSSLIVGFGLFALLLRFLHQRKRIQKLPLP